MTATAATASPLILTGTHAVMRRMRRRVIRHEYYTAGATYATAPHGWHRYHARPRDWHHRGCIIVGRFWYCR